MSARLVSYLTGPSPGAFYKLYLQIWYVVIRVLLDVSSSTPITCPEDEPVRSETCRANIRDE